MEFNQVLVTHFQVSMSYHQVLAYIMVIQLTLLPQLLSKRKKFSLNQM